MTAGQAKFFYGWIVVGAAFVGTFFAFGIAYSFGPFFPAIETAFQASRSDVALVSAIAGCLLFSLGAASGPLADRLGPAAVASTGMILIACGLLAASRATELWHVYLAYGLGVGVGTGCIYIPAISAVQRWFVRRRGLASGLAVMGIGAGTLVTPPVANWLIELQGWRGAMTTLALAVAAIGGLAMLALRHSPEKRGLNPDGGPPPDPAAPAGPAATLREALGAGEFWLLGAAGMFISFSLFVPLVHMVPYVLDHGMDEATGAWLLGVIGVSSIAGRFLVGVVADRLGRLKTLIGVYIGLAVMLAFWHFAREVWTLALFAAVFGTLYGGFAPLMPAIVADVFGVRHLGSILGVNYSGAGLGVLLGPTMAGLLFDLTGGYGLAIAVAVAGMLAGAVCLAVTAARRRE
ncbi:MCT family MFS transporter [Minwuia thermotolerans]|uniref:MFS transporter n=1 Tax=Minwuia thermotolerans TaxID=2056226 RepID=A0A2M9FVG4_9PROT|nr:MCT family MFS transporter [Minwuia thermotolerans]PJK27436.1 MFS transporter [Minwuia thermotolerans]